MNSQNTPFQALDKALLSPSRVDEKPGGAVGNNQDNKQTRKQGSQLGGNRTSLPTTRQASQESSMKEETPARPVPFEPDAPRKQLLRRKQTFELSQGELDFLDEVKFQLRELDVTKNEVIRTALELLSKDYQANKETSFLVRKFIGNKPAD
jgi:hypothetical protein